MSSSLVSDPKCKHLLDLPSEIRVLIYKHVLISKIPIVFDYMAAHSGVDTSILLTCKSVLAETLPILYGMNHFHFLGPTDVEAFIYSDEDDDIEAHADHSDCSYAVEQYRALAFMARFVQQSTLCAPGRLRLAAGGNNFSKIRSMSMSVQLVIWIFTAPRLLPRAAFPSLESITVLPASIHGRDYCSDKWSMPEWVELISCAKAIFRQHPKLNRLIETNEIHSCSYRSRGRCNCEESVHDIYCRNPRFVGDFRTVAALADGKMVVVDVKKEQAHIEDAGMEIYDHNFSWNERVKARKAATAVKSSEN